MLSVLIIVEFQRQVLHEFLIKRRVKQNSDSLEALIQTLNPIRRDDSEELSIQEVYGKFPIKNFNEMDIMEEALRDGRTVNALVCF